MLLGSYVYRAVHVAFVGVGDWYPGTKLAAFGWLLMSFKTADFPVFPVGSLYILKTKEEKVGVWEKLDVW